MEMIKSKKGIYFTMIGIVIISLVIGYSFLSDNSRDYQRSEIMEDRAYAMNDFLTDIEKDISRMIIISGYRTFLSLEKRISDERDYINDFDDVFFSIFINGSYNGTLYTLMDNSSMDAWNERINIESSVLNLNFDITANSIDVYHIDPYEVEIRLNATIYLKDFYEPISFNYSKEFSEKISIIDFEDPMYKVETNDKITNVIRKSVFSDFVIDATNDSTNFYLHLNESYYVESTDAPSFLMRMKGEFGPSFYGIESYVNLEDFNKQSLAIDSDNSLIDYEYFSDVSADYCSFDDLPSWFKIESSHLNDYELNRLGYVNC